MDAQSASLLSLSIAAASVHPIPLQPDTPQGIQLSSSIGSATTTTHNNNNKTHRRLSSTGKARRRLSDAREAANRPSPAVLHASPPALSLASLSLSSSPPSTTHPSSVPAASLTGAGRALAPDAHHHQHNNSVAVPLNDGSNVPRVATSLDSSSVSSVSASAPSNAKPIPIGTGKKRGIEHKCESCSKIYRHPSCLIKHRWEHTPHWREASKFVLSKHQQVQLLEAAAILSHLSPQSSSLPDDRSLWPSFLSGGSLPPPDPSTLMSGAGGEHRRSVSASVAATLGVGSATTAAAASEPSPPTANGGTGPRMHDYAIPVNSTSTTSISTTGTNNGNGNGNGVTQVRPGLFSIPTSTNGHPMSVPTTTSYAHPSWSLSESLHNHTGGKHRTRSGGWSLPRSSIRSLSGGSSRSRSHSDDDDNDVDNDGDDVMDHDHEHESESMDEEGDESSSSFGRRYYSSTSSSTTTNGINGRAAYAGAGYSHHRTQQPPPQQVQLPQLPKMWKRDTEEESMLYGSMMAGWSLREEDEYEKVPVPNATGAGAGGTENKVVANGEEKEWDGMEMEMDMD